MWNQQPDVTIIVATYNPKIDKLKKTLRSIIFQQGIKVEIIITDDGSSYFPLEDIDKFMHSNHFPDYKVICNEVNRGTVYNVFAGLEKATGKYVKLISPGDCFATSKSLRLLFDEIENSKVKMVFGDVIYYTENHNVLTINRHYAHPQNTCPYMKSKTRDIWFNYLILDDTIHGVSTLCQKNVLLDYIERALNKVIYSEDCLYRVMVNEGISISYCPKGVVLYSYGEGISTSNNDKWKQLIKKDLRVTDEMIISNLPDIHKLKLFKLAIRWRDSKSIFSFVKMSVISPKFLISKMRTRIRKRYTSESMDESFYKQCCE